MWHERFFEILNILQTRLPLPAFVFFGSLIEEIVSPIPSTLIQISAGGLAAGREYPLYGIILLGLIGSLGNTIGALLQYGIYRVIGKALVRLVGVRIGITPEKIEQLRAFIQKGARDDVAIYILRAVPIVPFISPSAVSGILGISFWTFTIATFLGYATRNIYMLIVGFVGIDAFKHRDPRAIGLLLVVACIVGIIVYFSHRLRHAKDTVQIPDEA